MKLLLRDSGALRGPGPSAVPGSLLHGPTVGSGARNWTLWILTLLLLCVLPLAPAMAGGPTDGGGGFSAGGGEDEGTLPFGVDPGTGTILVGTLPDVRAVVWSVTGPGEIFFHELDSEEPGGKFLVILHGDLDVTLDLIGLADRDVDVYFSTGGRLLGGMAQAAIGNQTFAPFVLEEMTYELPLVQFFDPNEATSPVFGLFALGPDFERHRLSVRSEYGLIGLRQRSSF